MFILKIDWQELIKIAAAVACVSYFRNIDTLPSFLKKGRKIPLKAFLNIKIIFELCRNEIKEIKFDKDNLRLDKEAGSLDY